MLGLSGQVSLMNQTFDFLVHTIILLAFLACATIGLAIVVSCLLSLINLYSAVVYLIMGVT